MCVWQNSTGKYVLYGFDLPACRPRSIFVLLLFTRGKKKNLPTHNIAIIPHTKYLGEGIFRLGLRIKVMQF